MTIDEAISAEWEEGGHAKAPDYGDARFSFSNESMEDFARGVSKRVIAELREQVKKEFYGRRELLPTLCKDAIELARGQIEIDTCLSIVLALLDDAEKEKE